MRAFTPRLLILAASLAFVACGGVESVDDLGDGYVEEGWEEGWGETAAESDPLIAAIRVVEAQALEGSQGSTTPIPGVVPNSIVGGSSPDPIPARHAVSVPAYDRRVDLQFPECEPFPAGIWREACNRSLGARSR